jgi:hypothetical protein
MRRCAFWLVSVCRACTFRGMHLRKMHPWGDAPSIFRFGLSRMASAIPLHGRGAHMAQRANQFSETTNKGIREATDKRGFSSPTAFFRCAVEQELVGHKEELVSAEGRLAASIEQVRQAVLPLGRAQQALVPLPAPLRTPAQLGPLGQLLFGVLLGACLAAHRAGHAEVLHHIIWDAELAHTSTINLGLSLCQTSKQGDVYPS